jgi:hypothetical protein
MSRAITCANGVCQYLFGLSLGTRPECALHPSGLSASPRLVPITSTRNTSCLSPQRWACASVLVDQISAELLDHLIVCRTCSVIFAAQEHSLEEAECVEGKRITSESTVRCEDRGANLAIRHLTEQSLDDYIFDRLACDQPTAAARTPPQLLLAVRQNSPRARDPGHLDQSGIL